MRTLIRYNRANELFDWDGLLQRFFEDAPLWNTRTPSVDVREREEGYLMEVELPGLTDKDIELKVEENILTVSSKKEDEKEEKVNGYLIRERRGAEFCRTFVLPKDVEHGKIKAELKNGLLSVEIPKKEESKPRRIDVQVN
jgi:HSP20 family protein